MNILTNYPFFERSPVHLVEENIIDIYFNPSFYDHNNNNQIVLYFFDLMRTIKLRI